MVMFIASRRVCWVSQSLRPSQVGLTFNVDQAVAAVMREQPLIEFISSLLGVRLPGSI